MRGRGPASAFLAFALTAFSPLHADLRSPRVLSPHVADTYSLKAFARFEGFRGLEGDALALRVMRYLTDPETGIYPMGIPAREGPPGEIPELSAVTDPVKLLNVYPIGHCGTLGPAAAALFEGIGLGRARTVVLPGWNHVAAEVHYAGSWHYVDLDVRAVFLRPDGTLASLEEARRDPRLWERPNGPLFFPLDSIPEVREAYARTRVEHRYDAASGGHTMDYVLRRGEKFTRWWRPRGGRWNPHPSYARAPFPRSLFERAPRGPKCKHTSFTVHTHGNGRFYYAPDLREGSEDFEDGALASENVAPGPEGLTLIEDGRGHAVFEFRTPYVIAPVVGDLGDPRDDRGAARVRCEGRGVRLAILREGGAGWEDLGPAPLDCDLTPYVSGRYAYRLRLELEGEPGRAAVRAFEVETWVLLHPASLPALRHGRNRMRLVTGDHYGLPTRLVVLESNFEDPAAILRHAVPPLPDIDPARRTARVRGELTLRVDAPPGTRIAWFSAGGSFRTHTGAEARRTRNEIAWAAEEPRGFRLLYRSDVPEDQSHWHYNVDREVRLEEPAKVIFVRYRGDPGLNKVRIRAHVVDGKPRPRPPAVVTHVWREGGRIRRRAVELLGDGAYEITTGADPENIAVEIAVPSSGAAFVAQEDGGSSGPPVRTGGVAAPGAGGAGRERARGAPLRLSGEVRDLEAFHRAGRTFLTWREVTEGREAEEAAAAAARDWKSFERARRRLAERVRYRVYRSDSPIDSTRGLEPAAEVGPWSAWNTEYYGIDPPRGARPFRYVIEEGEGPLPSGVGLYVSAPEREAKAYYAVTAVVGGRERRNVTAANALLDPVQEAPGSGEPVLQRTWRPETFQYLRSTTLHHFTRWEAPPNAAARGKPFDYLVGEPELRVRPAPVGIHLHCWGGSLEGGYGWWYNAERGAMLLATNQIPYDWWTGYHERLFSDPPPRTPEEWRRGVVRPYTQRRILSFLDWMGSRWEIDRTRVFAAGSSMGGSGSLMLAIRYPERIAWAVSWVGVHVPRLSPQFRSSYARVYGEPEWGVRFEDGTPVWDYFDDVRYLRKHPEAEVGLLIFSNGRNDSGIGWRQAVEFFRALQETRRPHVFLWGTAGHGQRTRMPGTLAERVLALDVRTDRSLPAFTRSTLDGDPGDGDPARGDPEGQANLYLLWDDTDIADTPARWEATLYVHERAPKLEARADVTPRRLQRFRPGPGSEVRWRAVSKADGSLLGEGKVQADRRGLVTVAGVRILQTGTRLILERAGPQ